MKNILKKHLETVPSRAVPLITLLKSHYPHVIVTKPVTNEILNMIGDDLLVIQWLSSIYADVVICLDITSIDDALLKYYKVCCELLNSQANLGLSNENKALQHITMDDIDNITSTCIYIKTVHLFKLSGVL
jgi:hypothetical protein